MKAQFPNKQLTALKLLISKFPIKKYTCMYKKRWLTLLSSLVLIGSLFLFVSTAQELWATVRVQAARVEVQTQANSPILITSISIVPSDPKAPTFGYEVVNVGSKAISAYVVRHDTYDGDVQSGGSGMTFKSMWSFNSLLHPYARHDETFAGVTYGTDISKIVLSVDFVEFADGSTWGADTFQTSEKLAGRRAGGRAVIKKLRDIRKVSGLKTVSDTIESDTNPLPVVTITTAEMEKSQLWKEGFDEGVRIVRVRLKNAHRKGGSIAMEVELSKQYDVSEERQR
ncbi:MAG: hypothetical protein MSG64_14985 [Pyrinomonadaceae bacterium MAG19_C2-C3]|nr:hypothetical protein [Pyrinomonadaceae bacterium MAG19_C2-C3]